MVDANKSLMEAAKAGEYEQARLMLNRGVDVNMKDSNGWTPLHWASRSGHLSTVRLLLQEKANVNSANNAGQTPLHLASLHGRVEVGCLLLDNGADILAKNGTGRTPLQIANRQKTEAALRIHQAMNSDEDKLADILMEQNSEQKDAMILETVAKICVLKDIHKEKLEDLRTLRTAVGGLKRNDDAAEEELKHLKGKVDNLKSIIAGHEKELETQSGRVAQLAEKIREFERQDRVNEVRGRAIQHEDNTLIAAATALKNKVEDFENREEQFKQTVAEIERVLGVMS